MRLGRRFFLSSEVEVEAVGVGQAEDFFSSPCAPFNMLLLLHRSPPPLNFCQLVLCQLCRGCLSNCTSADQHSQQPIAQSTRVRQLLQLEPTQLNSFNSAQLSRSHHHSLHPHRLHHRPHHHHQHNHCRAKVVDTSLATSIIILVFYVCDASVFHVKMNSALVTDRMHPHLEIE